jgi:peptide methionine sulfoxide reductase MsrA
VTFAAGCFVSIEQLGNDETYLADRSQWGVEHLFSKYYGHLPQFKAAVGYTGGNADATDPSE